MAVKVVPTIVFGPNGIGLDLQRSPSLATDEVTDEIAWQEVAIAWTVVVVASFATVKWLLWPVARWVIALVTGGNP